MFALSDGVRKWAVVAPSEPLPPRWRVALRRRLLARQEIAKVRRTDLLIIGHPKSGNTWLRTMLSRLYGFRHGLPEDLVVTSDELTRRNPAVPRITATNGWYSYEGAVGALLAPGAPDDPVRYKPIVFLARNPADIAVSWYHQVTKRQSRHKFELVNEALARPIDRRTIGMWDFVRHSDLGLVNLIDFLNTWERNVATLPHAITVRYEELRAEPGPTLRRIVEHMGDSCCDEELNEAVRFGAFDHLGRLEQQGFFRQGGLKRRDPNDPNARKVRRAKVGGFRDDFTSEQVAELEALMVERLSPSLGYTSVAPAARAAATA